MIVVRYVHQSTLDMVARLTGKTPTWEKIEEMKSSIKVSSVAAAERVVEALRLSGHIASWIETDE